MSFRNKGYEKKTKLSKYPWYLKYKGEDAAKALPFIGKIKSRSQFGGW